MRKLKFLSIALILIVGMIFTFQSCNKDENFQQNSTNDFQPNLKVNWVNQKDIPNLINNLQQNYNNELFSKDNGSLNLDLEKIMEVVDSLGNKKTTFRINNYYKIDSLFVFNNLIVSEDINGIINEPTVISYQMSKDFTKKFVLGEIDLSSFNGNILIYTLNDFIENLQSLNNKGVGNPNALLDPCIVFYSNWGTFSGNNYNNLNANSNSGTGLSGGDDSGGDGGNYGGNGNDGGNNGGNGNDGGSNGNGSGIDGDNPIGNGNDNDDDDDDDDDGSYEIISPRFFKVNSDDNVFFFDKDIATSSINDSTNEENSNNKDNDPCGNIIGGFHGIQLVPVDFFDDLFQIYFGEYPEFFDQNGIINQNVLNWLQDPSNAYEVHNIFAYLQNIPNGLYDEYVDFDKEAILTLMNDGVVDFPNKLLFTSDFLNNTCLNCVYDKFIQNSTNFRNYVKNFDGQFPVTNLKFDVSSDLPDNTNALTSVINISNKLITITFNSNELDRPELDIARTFIHEVIHAEIYRKLYSIIGTNNVGITQQNLNNLRNNFPGIYDYYMRYLWNVPIGSNLSDPQHNMMAQHYRSIISDAISDFDGNANTSDTYNALAWSGLMDSGVFDFDTLLYSNSTIAWQNLPYSDRLIIYNSNNSFDANNSDCQ